MKADFHPEVHADAKTTCVSCSTVYAIPTTVKEQQVEVCANCSPAYTGEYRSLSSSGQVDRFRKRQEAAEKKKAEMAEKKPNKRKK